MATITDSSEAAAASADRSILFRSAELFFELAARLELYATLQPPKLVQAAAAAEATEAVWPWARLSLSADVHMNVLNNSYSRYTRMYL